MLVATALYHRETQLGYIVYEPGEIASYIYETLCVQISKSISSALVFTEKVELENELNSALNKLEVINGELHDISRTDELTGLLNRRGFLSLGQQSINLSLGMGKKGLVIFGDLDGLKAINDTWGHDVGDRALKAIAEILRRTFRSADVLARLSGDEFVVVTIDADSGSMETFNRRIEDLLRDWNQNSGEPYRLSISIGAVEYSQDSADLTKLLLFADGLLYEKKNAKKTIR